MFKRSGGEQKDMFRDVTTLMSKTAQKHLTDSTSWNRVFHEQFTIKVDEGIYSVLYVAGMGRPNAPIRRLLGMMVLKEFNGWSDEQLFDECMFNLRVRDALGLCHIDDSPPVGSTYYEFRARVARHLEETGEDLVEQSFAQVSMEQLATLALSGEKTRMDSKLIQSNIARQNRLQLIVEAVRVSIRKLNLEQLAEDLSVDQYQLLEHLQEKSTSNITYQLDKAGKEEMLITFGYIIRALIEHGIIDQGHVLHKIYTEQYEEEQGGDDVEHGKGVHPQSPEHIASDSVQSIHDPTAAYRKKGKGENVQIVQGYHSNITETCDEAGKPNLITDVITTPANVSECEYLLPAIERTNEKLAEGNEVQEVNTDGGYDSIDNRKTLQQANAPQLKMQKLKGAQRVYEVGYDDKGQLEVKDKKTGNKLETIWSERAQKYRITHPNGGYRYFTLSEVEDYINTLKMIGDYTQEDYNLRASVESTIHEVFHRLSRRSKIRYRGLIKCHWYVLMRALSVNLGRIQRYWAKKELENEFAMLTALIGVHITTTQNICTTNPSSN